jgi:hypothetical protein
MFVCCVAEKKKGSKFTIQFWKSATTLPAGFHKYFKIVTYGMSRSFRGGSSLLPSKSPCHFVRQNIDDRLYYVLPRIQKCSIFLAVITSPFHTVLQEVHLNTAWIFCPAAPNDIEGILSHVDSPTFFCGIPHTLVRKGVRSSTSVDPEIVLPFFRLFREDKLW